MTQGIRDFVNARFADLLPKRKEFGDTEFRRAVMTGAVATFGISIASAATHYNFALKAQRLADPKSVEGLGRPEGKKGGRKPIHLVDVVREKDGKPVATGLSKGAAEVLIAKAEKARKAKLVIKGPDPVVAVVLDALPAEPAAEVTAA